MIRRSSRVRQMYRPPLNPTEASKEVRKEVLPPVRRGGVQQGKAAGGKLLRDSKASCQTDLRIGLHYFIYLIIDFCVESQSRESVASIHFPGLTSSQGATGTAGSPCWPPGVQLGRQGMQGSHLKISSTVPVCWVPIQKGTFSPGTETYSESVLRKVYIYFLLHPGRKEV